MGERPDDFESSSSDLEAEILALHAEGGGLSIGSSGSELSDDRGAYDRAPESPLSRAGPSDAMQLMLGGTEAGGARPSRIDLSSLSLGDGAGAQGHSYDQLASPMSSESSFAADAAATFAELRTLEGGGLLSPDAPEPDAYASGPCLAPEATFAAVAATPTAAAAPLSGSTLDPAAAAHKAAEDAEATRVSAMVRAEAQAREARVMERNSASARYSAPERSLEQQSSGVVVTLESPGQSSASTEALSAEAAPLGTPHGGSAEALPPDWQEAVAADGSVYFYHVQTRQTSWQRPPPVALAPCGTRAEAVAEAVQPAPSLPSTPLAGMASLFERASLPLSAPLSAPGGTIAAHSPEIATYLPITSAAAFGVGGAAALGIAGNSMPASTRASERDMAESPRANATSSCEGTLTRSNSHDPVAATSTRSSARNVDAAEDAPPPALGPHDAPRGARIALPGDTPEQFPRSSLGSQGDSSRFSSRLSAGSSACDSSRLSTMSLPTWDSAVIQATSDDVLERLRGARAVTRREQRKQAARAAASTGAPAISTSSSLRPEPPGARQPLPLVSYAGGLSYTAGESSMPTAGQQAATAAAPAAAEEPDFTAPSPRDASLMCDLAGQAGTQVSDLMSGAGEAPGFVVSASFIASSAMLASDSMPRLDTPVMELGTTGPDGRSDGLQTEPKSSIPVASTEEVSTTAMQPQAAQSQAATEAATRSNNNAQRPPPQTPLLTRTVNQTYERLKEARGEPPTPDTPMPNASGLSQRRAGIGEPLPHSLGEGGTEPTAVAVDASVEPVACRGDRADSLGCIRDDDEQTHAAATDGHVLVAACAVPLTSLTDAMQLTHPVASATTENNAAHPAEASSGESDGVEQLPFETSFEISNSGGSDSSLDLSGRRAHAAAIRSADNAARAQLEQQFERSLSDSSDSFSMSAETLGFSALPHSAQDRTSLEAFYSVVGGSSSPSDSDGSNEQEMRPLHRRGATGRRAAAGSAALAPQRRGAARGLGTAGGEGGADSSEPRLALCNAAGSGAERNLVAAWEGGTVCADAEDIAPSRCASRFSSVSSSDPFESPMTSPKTGLAAVRPRVVTADEAVPTPNPTAVPRLGSAPSVSGNQWRRDADVRTTPASRIIAARRGASGGFNSSNADFDRSRASSTSSLLSHDGSGGFLSPDSGFLSHSGSEGGLCSPGESDASGLFSPGARSDSSRCSGVSAFEVCEITSPAGGIQSEVRTADGGASATQHGGAVPAPSADGPPARDSAAAPLNNAGSSAEEAGGTAAQAPPLCTSAHIDSGAPSSIGHTHVDPLTATSSGTLALPPFWVQANTSDGRVYYYHRKTLETTWQRPGMLGPNAASGVQLLPTDGAPQASQRACGDLAGGSVAASPRTSAIVQSAAVSSSALPARMIAPPLRLSHTDESAAGKGTGAAAITETAALPTASALLAEQAAMRAAEGRAKEALAIRLREVEGREESLEAERTALAVRSSDIEARESQLRAREAEFQQKHAQLKEWAKGVEVHSKEQAWEHWRRDAVRQVMAELVRKVPSHEWRSRMQRALTTLELYKRENLRLRKEAQRLAPAVVARGGGARLMVDRTSSSADLDGSSSGDGADGGTGLTAARGSTAYDRGVSEALLDEFEQMKIQLAEAQAEAAAARKLSESRERYLAVVDTQAAEQHSRNEAQQRRLEHLSSENSKLRRELTRLRAETSAERMEVFEMEMLKQELKGAKESASAMEQQLMRMHNENRALRDGDGLHRELGLATKQLREALDAKSLMQQAMRRRAEQAQVEVFALYASLADAEAEICAIHTRTAESLAAEESRASLRFKNHYALAKVARQALERTALKAAAALHIWREAVMLATVAEDLEEIRGKVTVLGGLASSLDEATTRLEVAEAGTLRAKELSLLHDNWKEVVLRELRAAEAEASSSTSKLVDVSRSLQRREDDVALMIHRYDNLQREHSALEASIAAAVDGSATHVLHLQREIEAAAQLARSQSEAIMRLNSSLASEREALVTREAQLSALIASMDAKTAGYEASLLRESSSLATLRTAYTDRCSQLLLLVRDLSSLAYAEKMGKIDHEARARLFRTSAAIYHTMGREGGADIAAQITREQFESLFGRAALGALPPPQPNAFGTDTHYGTSNGFASATASRGVASGSTTAVFAAAVGDIGQAI